MTQAKTAETKTATAQKTQEVKKSTTGVAPGGKLEETKPKTEEAAKTEQPKAKTIEEIIKTVEVLNTKIATRDQVNRHINQVEKLKFGEFQEKDCLILQSGAGESYTIKSPKLLKQVQVLMLETLSSEKQLIEAEINF